MKQNQYLEQKKTLNGCVHAVEMDACMPWELEVCKAFWLWSIEQRHRQRR